MAMMATAIVLNGRACAQTFSNNYTSTAEKDGHVAATGQVSSAFPRKAGLILLLTEDDLRQAVSVGNRKAAKASRPLLKALVHSIRCTPTVECCAVQGKPFAIIQRWRTADKDGPNKNLVQPTRA